MSHSLLTLLLKEASLKETSPFLPTMHGCDVWSHVCLDVGEAQWMSGKDRLLDEGLEQRTSSRNDWIQEHQAGKLECLRYRTYTNITRPHQPLLVGSVLVISQQSATTGEPHTRNQ